MSSVNRQTADIWSANDRFNYRSSDASNASQRPKLVIQYTIPSATNTPTVTPTATATETPSATPVATNTPSFTPTATQTPPPQGPVTITYDYDPLYRLTAADYSTSDYYHYSYDAVGNRETQETMTGGLLSTDSYNYDDANRLIDVDGVLYSWDDNGNLLSDGINTYTYDSANRLKTLTDPSVNANYAYNGLGGRLQETLNGNTTSFTMDLNMGLTQALSDGTNTYVYGLGRAAQTQGTATEYFLGDALGSVRQMASDSGVITYARTYDPYGVVTTTIGSSQSAYGYTGEYSGDYIDLLYLRARFYAPGIGRFLTRDTWDGNVNKPMSYNAWLYVYGNPINYSDPTGQCPQGWIRNPNGTCSFPLFPSLPGGGFTFTAPEGLTWLFCGDETTIFQQPNATVTPQPFTPTPSLIQITSTPQSGTPTPQSTPASRDLTPDERKHLNRIMNYDVWKFMAEHPDAPREAGGWKNPKGNHYGETLQNIAMLTNSINVLQRAIPYLNQSARQEAMNGITQGESKIAILTAWLNGN